MYNNPTKVRFTSNYIVKPNSQRENHEWLSSHCSTAIDRGMFQIYFFAFYMEIFLTFFAFFCFFFVEMQSCYAIIALIHVFSSLTLAEARKRVNTLVLRTRALNHFFGPLRMLTTSKTWINPIFTLSSASALEVDKSIPLLCRNELPLYQTFLGSNDPGKKVFFSKGKDGIYCFNTYTVCICCQIFVKLTQFVYIINSLKPVDFGKKKKNCTISKGRVAIYRHWYLKFIMIHFCQELTVKAVKIAQQQLDLHIENMWTMFLHFSIDTTSCLSAK